MMHSNSWPCDGSWATPFLDPEGWGFKNVLTIRPRYKGRLVVSTPISTIISTIILYKYIYMDYHWLVVSTILKNISQWEGLKQI